jgi:AraC-like DNA-binding protein
MRLDAYRLGTITAGRLSYGRDVRLLADDVRAYHVNVPLQGRAVSKSGASERVASSPDCAAVFHPGRPAEISWNGDCQQLCLMIPTSAVEQELQHLLGHSPKCPVEFTPAMNLAAPVTRSWRDALGVLLREFDLRGGLAAEPLAARHLERLLLAGLLLGQPHNYSEAITATRPAAAPTAVRRAIELLESHPDREWSTSLLASEVFVSPRSLQGGFRRELGLPPMSYLRNVRLRRVHEELVEAAPGSVSVGAVASRWGFVHMGRFAASYRTKFGAAPSTTLARGAGPHT